MAQPTEQKSPLIPDVEAAEYLRLSPDTLRTWGCTRKVDVPFVKIGGRVFYRLSDLDRFIESCTHRPAIKRRAAA